MKALRAGPWVVLGALAVVLVEVCALVVTVGLVVACSLGAVFSRR